MKSRFFTLHIPIYDCHVSFSLGQNDQQIIDSLNRKGVKDFNGEITGLGRCTALKTGGPYIIRTKNYPKDARTIGVLAHEIFHCSTFILEDRAIKFDMSGGDETHAYLIQYITEKVFQKI